MTRDVLTSHSTPPAVRVFVSYSRRDRACAARMAQVIRLAGADAFRDEESIPPGKQWRAALTEALGAVSCVLVLWSANAAASAEVRTEYLAAIEARKDVVPVLLDDTPLTDELAAYQWIDFRAFVTFPMPRPNIWWPWSATRWLVERLVRWLFPELLTPCRLVGRDTHCMTAPTHAPREPTCREREDKALARRLADRIRGAGERG